MERARLVACSLWLPSEKRGGCVHVPEPACGRLRRSSLGLFHVSGSEERKLFSHKHGKPAHDHAVVSCRVNTKQLVYIGLRFQMGCEFEEVGFAFGSGLE